MASLTRKYSNKGIIGRGNELIKIPLSQDGQVSIETRHVFLALLNMVTFKTSDDSIQGSRLADAIDEAKGKDIIEIGEGVHDWLVNKINDVNRTQFNPEGFPLCPFIFRVNGEIVSQFLKEGFQKAHQPSEKKKGKGKADEALASKE